MTKEHKLKSLIAAQAYVQDGTIASYPSAHGHNLDPSVVQSSQRQTNAVPQAASSTVVKGTHPTYQRIIIAGLALLSAGVVLILGIVLWKCRRHLGRRRRRAVDSEAAHGTNQELERPASLSTDERTSGSLTANDTRTVGGSPAQSSVTLVIPDRCVHRAKVSKGSDAAKRIGCRPLSKRSRLSDLTLNTATASMRSMRSDVNTPPTSGSAVDDHIDRLNRALQCSPTIGAMLTESFDMESVRHSEGEVGCKSFDWGRCAFDEVEEEAMWLPAASIDSGRSHVQSSSNLVSPQGCLSHGTIPLSSSLTSVQNNSVSSLLASQSLPGTPMTRAYPTRLFTQEASAETEVKEAQTSHIDELEICKSSLGHDQGELGYTGDLIKPSHSSSALAHSVVVSSNEQQSPSFSSNFLVVSRSNHQSCEYMVPRSPDPDRTTTLDSRCSTDSLRQAGAMAIRTGSNSKLTPICTPASLTSTIRKPSPTDRSTNENHRGRNRKGIFTNNIPRAATSGGSDTHTEQTAIAQNNSAQVPHPRPSASIDAPPQTLSPLAMIRPMIDA